MFDNQAEEAMKLYTSIFKNSRVVSTSPGPGGTVAGGTFILDGVEFSCYNAGAPDYFKIGMGISISVSCDTQAEIDKYWEALSAGGEKQMCGWVKDKVGVSWQIVPSILGQLLFDKDPAKAKRAIDAMLKMQKLDIQKLKDAHAGR